MLQRTEIYLPYEGRKVKIIVSIPKDASKSGIVYDTLYMLDGQNVFKDSDAAFGRSLRMGRYLSQVAKAGKHICCVAIYNAGSDLGRVNQYTPFRITKGVSEWKSQDISVFQMFEKDLVKVIVPYVREHFPVSLKPENTFLMGSSLGALSTSYLANHHPEIFGGAGLFSNCPFLCERTYYKDLKDNHNPKLRVFNYVGLEESSDGMFDKDAYYKNAVKVHERLLSYGMKSRLVVDVNGIHNEATWEKHIMQFLSFMYSDDIDITN